MTYPNTLVFVDFPSDDVDAARAFYAEVFNWEIEERIPGIFHRIVPGQNFKVDDGSQGPTGNLHMGLSNAANMRPHPDAEPTAPTSMNPGGRAIRAWILVSDDDSFDRILAAAERLGGAILWRDHFWTEFGGANASFLDPWGNQLMLWQHLPDAETDDDTHQVVGEFSVPEGWTVE
ncbi:MAG: VOC family protein [Acidimicrobiaceae bacterium]|nr:VOC family protein [Acidimicrobiaceae bacterium]